jgi:hypothetical protein
MISPRTNRKTDGLFMNEFLLLALLMIYLAISYVPGEPDSTCERERTKRSAHTTVEADDHKA